MKKKDGCSYQYLPCDKYVVFNDNDPSLIPIKVDQLDVIRRTYRYYGLDEPDDFPDFSLVDNYGLPPHEQFFKREEVHEGVKMLEQQVRLKIQADKKTRDAAPNRREILVINAFWEELELHPEKYKAEIAWIRKMWFYRLLGKYVLINGKVYWLPGAFWTYLNCWSIDGSPPGYRDRDRRWYLAVKYTELDTTTFKNREEKPPYKAIPDEETGDYEMIDLLVRTCLGMMNTKVRRAGDSTKAQENNTEYVTRTVGGKSGIQGKDDSNAYTMFTEHMVYPYNTHFPVYFKPLRDPSEKYAPKSEMNFYNDENPDIKALHSLIDFATSADALKYDSKKIHRLHIDESGKLENGNVIRRHNIVRLCLMVGGVIDGHCLYPTTVDSPTDLSAGERFLEFCYQSMWDQRDDTGSTASGLYYFHFRSTDGLFPYIDEYGMSMEPEAADYIAKKLKHYKGIKDAQGYADFKRQHPILFKDNFFIGAKNPYLNTMILQDRYDYLNFDARHLLAERGDFVRESPPDGKVKWVKYDPNGNLDGRFYKSIDLPPEQTNQRYLKGGIWSPKSPFTFIASGDTFGQDKTEGRASNGGGTVKYMHNGIIDKDGTDVLELRTDLPVCTYCFRPPTVEEYCEDMLMMSQYFNAMMYPERTKTNIIDHFRRRNYGGYLLYDIDYKTKKPKNNPGWWAGDKEKVTGFNYLKDDVQNNSTRWRHPDLITQCLMIPDPQHLTDFDLIASYIGCLIGERNEFYTNRDRPRGKINTSKFIRRRNYN
jgi:hypothetical protein